MAFASTTRYGVSSTKKIRHIVVAENPPKWYTQSTYAYRLS